VSVVGEKGKGGTYSEAIKGTLTEGASIPYKEKSTGRRKEVEKNRGRDGTHS